MKLKTQVRFQSKTRFLFYFFFFNTYFSRDEMDKWDLLRRRSVVEVDYFRRSKALLEARPCGLACPIFSDEMLLVGTS